MIPASFRCSLSGELLDDPVVDPCGHVFNRSAIREWLELQTSSTSSTLTSTSQHLYYYGCCPISRKPLEWSDLRCHHALAERIDRWKWKHEHYYNARHQALLMHALTTTTRTTTTTRSTNRMMENGIDDDCKQQDDATIGIRTQENNHLVITNQNNNNNHDPTGTAISPFIRVDSSYETIHLQIEPASSSSSSSFPPRVEDDENDRCDNNDEYDSSSSNDDDDDDESADFDFSCRKTSTPTRTRRLWNQWRQQRKRQYRYTLQTNHHCLDHGIHSTSNDIISVSPVDSVQQKPLPSNNNSVSRMVLSPTTNNKKKMRMLSLEWNLLPQELEALSRRQQYCMRARRDRQRHGMLRRIVVYAFVMVVVCGILVLLVCIVWWAARGGVWNNRHNKDAAVSSAALDAD